jgi:hypothetical protein
MTHSRNGSNQSQDSTVSFRSIDLLSSRASQESASYYQDMLMTVHDQALRRGSHTLSTEPYFDERVIEQHQQQQQQQHISNGFAYGMHSLPRKNCVHHQHDQFHSHSLPRRDHQHHHSHMHDTRRMSAYIPQEHHIVPRRFSYAVVTHDPMQSIQLYKPPSFYPQPSVKPDEELVRSDESCLSGESGEEDEADEEQEIFIDFKPRISPVPSPKLVTTKKKKLVKTLSEGEILVDRQKDRMDQQAIGASASEEDLKVMEVERSLDHLHYTHAPIQDEDVCKPDILKQVTPMNGGTKREAFRKRSVSLEDPAADLQPVKKLSFAKSAPPSPCLEELSVPTHSAFPSSDSLTNNESAAKDHSDGIWNESQCTVLRASISSTEKIHISPATRRKHLLLQHLQRSSLDTEALDIEDIADQVSVFRDNDLSASKIQNNLKHISKITEIQYKFKMAPIEIILIIYS